MERGETVDNSHTEGKLYAIFKFPTATLKYEKEMGEINFNDVLFNLIDPKYPISVESI